MSAHISHALPGDDAGPTGRSAGPHRGWWFLLTDGLDCKCFRGWRTSAKKNLLSAWHFVSIEWPFGWETSQSFIIHQGSVYCRFLTSLPLFSRLSYACFPMSLFILHRIFLAWDNSGCLLSQARLSALCPMAQAGADNISSESFSSVICQWAIRSGFELAVNWHVLQTFWRASEDLAILQDFSCGDLIVPFRTSQDLEAVREELTRTLAMTAINCPVFSGIQKSNDNCVVDICFCVKSDVAFIPDTLHSSPRGYPGLCAAVVPLQDSTLPR